MGRIILARFLERSTRSLKRLVARTDEEAVLLNASCDPGGSTRPFAISTIPGTVWQEQPGGGPRTLGCVEGAGDTPRPVYRAEAFVREYRSDDRSLDKVLARQGERQRISSLRLLGRMRLINSRNRLTHVIISALLDRQAAFVTTGDPARLSPLTQRNLVDHLQGLPPGDAPAADTSRVSRVLASGSVVLSGGQEVELRRLCPSARDVHRELVRDLFRREQARIVAGEIDEPLTDDEIAEDVSARGAGPTSRRAVAFIRKDLGVPNVWARARRGCYLTVTAGFSILRRVDSVTMTACAPWAPGVYELRIESPGVEYPAGLSPVIYLGSSNSLRKRLLEHIGGNGRNAQLASYLKSERVQVRWMVVPEGWRSVERDVYRQFVETFGTQPVCNRMSP